MQDGIFKALPIPLSSNQHDPHWLSSSGIYVRGTGISYYQALGDFLVSFMCNPLRVMDTFHEDCCI